MSEPVLLLDVGNSSVKWILAVGDQLLERGVSSFDRVPEDIGNDVRGTTVFIASVASLAREQILQARLEGLGCRCWFARSVAEAGGLINAYADPERLGVDRWLAMLGALRRASKGFCVADAGSALTIDLVDARGDHRGGYILPGLAPMQQALLTNTDRVRFESAGQESLAPGCSTAEAVRHGLLLAHCGAINTAIQRFGEWGQEPELFLCGGDGARLQRLLSFPATLAPDLVFEGLVMQGQLEQVHGAANVKICSFTQDSY